MDSRHSGLAGSSPLSLFGAPGSPEASARCRPDAEKGNHEWCRPGPPGSGLGTANAGLAVLQVRRALWICRKLPLAGSPPRPARLAHRVIGFGLFALTVPIAVHCLLAYGVQLTSVRVAVHSIAGCFFYGAFVAKVLLVQSRRLPGWVLPAAGGTPAVVVGLLCSTSPSPYSTVFHLPSRSPS